MKNKVLAGLAVAVIAIAGIGGYTLINNNKNDSVKSVTVTKTVTSDKITYSADKKTVNYAGEVDKAALETLQSLTTVQTEDSSFGKMVISINGLASEKSKNYWAFYVNDAYASEGAGTYKAKVGDKIKWHLEDITQ